MKRVLKFVGAALRDAWEFMGSPAGLVAVFVACILMLMVAHSARAAEDTKSPNDRIGIIKSNSGNSVIILQRGRFDCPAFANRAIFLDGDGTVIVGCATIGPDKIDITFEDGEHVTLKGRST